ncbi:MAG: hypothetical protein HRT89_08745 [Lentisphaeria bacterium]|nr:hypothetical protein [Lentisphaeria bacterium]NQZ68145.1 hypothetical protein [Lentisphaeria bacterium]
MSIKLKGLTWNHARGWGPMDAVGDAYRQSGKDVLVDWDIQPLEGFESRPLDELTDIYDLLIIDHPHVGIAAESSLLLPVGELEDAYTSCCRESYDWNSENWAVPIDAACHVSAVKGCDSIAGKTWQEIIDMSASQPMGIPLKGVHSLMALLTLLATNDTPLDPQNGFPEDMTKPLDVLLSLSKAAHSDSLDWNPIVCLDALSKGDIQMIPLTFGYSSIDDKELIFGELPSYDGTIKAGGILGGTGIAVSATTKHPEEALDFAHFCGSGFVQTNHWAEYGGQPAHRQAWDELSKSEPFYRNTYSTQEGVYLRPRFNGWCGLQTEMGQVLEDWLRDGSQTISLIDNQLRELWQNSQLALQP